MALVLDHKIAISGETLNSVNNFSIASFDLATAKDGGSLDNCTISFKAIMIMMRTDVSPKAMAFCWHEACFKRTSGTITISSGQTNTIPISGDAAFPTSTLGINFAISGTQIQLQVSPSGVATGTTIDYAGYIKIIASTN